MAYLDIGIKVGGDEIGNSLFRAIFRVNHQKNLVCCAYDDEQPSRLLNLFWLLMGLTRGGGYIPIITLMGTLLMIIWIIDWKTSLYKTPMILLSTQWRHNWFQLMLGWFDYEYSSISRFSIIIKVSPRLRNHPSLVMTTIKYQNTCLWVMKIDK